MELSKATHGDETCRPRSLPGRAGEGRQNQPATLTNRQRDDNPKKQIGRASSSLREFLWLAHEGSKDPVGCQGEGPRAGRPGRQLEAEAAIVHIRDLLESIL